MMKITKYEKAQIIGTRATQIANGAKPTIEINGYVSAIEIAEREYKANKIPLIIKRTLPNGSSNSFKVSELYD